MRWLLLFLLWSSSLYAAEISSPKDSVKIESTVLPSQYDAWFSKDKFDHFCASAFLTGLGYYAARKELHNSDPASRNIAVGFSFSLGVSKEVYDKVSKKGTPSYKDIIADVLGTAVAFMIISASSQ